MLLHKADLRGEWWVDGGLAICFWWGTVNRWILPFCLRDRSALADYETYGCE